MINKLIRKNLAAVVLPLLLLSTPGHAADDEAYNWLEVMNRAVREQNYEGHFVYQAGDSLEAMYIVHTVDGGHEHERLLSLNGKAREVIREQDVVICRIQGQDGFIKEDTRPAGRRFSPLPPIRLQKIEQHYRFKLAGKTRVTGRQAQQVYIIPKDDLRYGYSLALDIAHGLPLRTLTVNDQGKTVSQILFTDIHIGDDVHDPHTPISVSNEDAGKRPPPDAESPPRRMHPSLWQFANVPAGFELLMRRYRYSPGRDVVEHFIFSDGLASISVYAERQPSVSFHGWSSMGSVQAYGREIGQYQVTAVGEVPRKTLAMLLEGMKLREG